MNEIYLSIYRNYFPVLISFGFNLELTKDIIFEMFKKCNNGTRTAHSWVGCNPNYIITDVLTV